MAFDPHGNKIEYAVVWFRWSCLILTTASTVISPSYAQDFIVRTVSAPEAINRDPVISETGMAAWMYYGTNVIVSSHSHIAIYNGTNRMDLTDGLTTTLYGAAKPSVHSNRVVFIANHSQRLDPTEVNWVLREVAVRDEGDIRELPAAYRATEEGGEQRLISVFGQMDSTNEVVVPVTGLDTNAPRRHPSGESEIWSWRMGDEDIQRVTSDARNDYAPSLWGDTVAWQKAKGWPFGWEIMALVDGTMMQLTTNYYYEMAPKVHGNKIVWYGWDGFDYEIFLFDSEKNETIQITSNRFDDVAPQVWGDVVVWEGYAGVEADVYIWKDGEIRQISTNIDDDLYPRIWNNKVVWQGFDGDDFEIYLYDIDRGGDPIKITSNNYDDTNPEIHDNLIVWMGYHDNWDSEIFYADIRNLSSPGDIQVVRLTDREEDDRDPKTASRRIVWVSEVDGNTQIMLAEPR
jgi:beta propeller repeat protein